VNAPTIIIAAVPHPVNWSAGWFLILAGFLAGALLGLGYHREGFLGGYASFRRRMARLGHIALTALGMLNLLYGLSALPAAGSLAAAIAGPALLAGGILMPAVCFLASWREPFRQLFFIPVLSLMTGVAAAALSGVLP
jgi:hypothetical protein